ncbi:hypothetical protein PRIPAC_70352 [Pristionchus pacificus]|uniref:Uncharacterized protein n=1 Tax=Pristionchus pacificus TaxID=54126 RepID=A0A2A6C6H4_PRIPA|nr:hypothetical protein PRIPAC_70352 [Pristionchus pacificus]|eukprot:PDM73812.1 hypothetical protein PRIPAC_41168 [Pristionchus pacificus]
MSDNSRLADGQEGGSIGGFSQEAMDHLLDLLSPRPTHVTPQLTRPGFSKQAEFNTLVLNKLEEARKDPSVLEAVIELIKERNSFLVLADKNPKLLDALDTAKAIEGASGTSPSPILQAMMIAQTLSQVQSQSNDRKRRALSPSSSAGQPFRYRAPAFPQAAGALFPRLPSLAPHFAQFGPSTGYGPASGHQGSMFPFTARNSSTCHQCGQSGHFRATCPQLAGRSARRESEFVRNELRRLLSSGAIERAARPRVISPLSVAHGDRASLLSRALLHTVAVNQKSSLSPSTPIPLSPSERGSHREAPLQSTPSEILRCGEIELYSGQSGVALRELMSKVATVDPELAPVLTRSLQGAKAPATMRVYKGSMKQLRVFARKKGIDPSCPSSLLIFALRRFHEGRSLSSLKILHSAYSHFCDPLPPFFANLLSSLFDCTRRSHPVTHHPKVPSSHIHTIVRFASLHPTDFHIVRCALGAALAYGALLRVSELISLRWSDLSWSEGLLRVSIRKAKNDQFSESRETFISIGEESETLSLFDSYRSQVPLSVWVFPSMSHPLSHITSDSFRKDLYSLCSRVGISKFTPHQLRGGGAMESIRRGASIDQVQRRGRWRSIAGLTPYLSDTVETQGGSHPLP